MVGLKLQGGLVGLLLRRTMPDDRGPTLVRLLVQRLAEHQETGWLDAVCQELVNYGDVIAESPEACEILKEALCHSVLDDDTVLEHLLQLRHVSQGGRPGPERWERGSAGGVGAGGEQELRGAVNRQRAWRASVYKQVSVSCVAVCATP